MNALARFEGFMQELMDRRVVRLLGGNLQPVELAHALGRAMEEEASNSLAPDRFSLLLNPEDAADLRQLDARLEHKLTNYAVEHARERGFNFAAAPEVQLLADATLPRGAVQVRAERTSIPLPPRRERRGEGTPKGGKGVPCLEIEGSPEPLPLDHFPFSIGRRPGNDLVLPDPRISRQHAVIERQPDGYLLRDLHSRNGTRLNGQPVSEAELRDGDAVSIGSFEVRVRLA